MESLTLIAAGVLQGVGMSITLVIVMYIAEAIADKRAENKKNKQLQTPKKK